MLQASFPGKLKKSKPLPHRSVYRENGAEFLTSKKGYSACFFRTLKIKCSNSFCSFKLFFSWLFKRMIFFPYPADFFLVRIFLLKDIFFQFARPSFSFECAFCFINGHYFSLLCSFLFCRISFYLAYQSQILYLAFYSHTSLPSTEQDMIFEKIRNICYEFF